MRLAVLFGLVAAALAVVPLVAWSNQRADVLRADFDARLVENMETLQRRWFADGELHVDFPAWQVNEVDNWVDPISDTDIEPPLLTWARDAGESTEFRSFSQEDQSYRGYVNPVRPGESLVTVLATDALDSDLADLRRETLLLVLALVAVSVGLGWLGAGLALGPSRRLAEGQQGFLADAAHEMRTPLAVITASSSQALSRPRTSEEYVRSLAEIRSAAERASTGVNELLDLVRFDSGQVIPRLAPLRLDLLAEEVAASARADTCEVVAEPGEPMVVNADMALLRQALDNLVRNSTRRSSRVDLVSSTDGRFGVVAVNDNGPGFDPDRLDTVFDRYERGDRSGDAGLGLAIVKAVVDAHGGIVEASNRPEGGATVTVKVPLMAT